MAVYKGFEMLYAINSSAQAGACNANLGLTVAPVWAGARADDNPTRILQRRNSHLERAPFCVSGARMNDRYVLLESKISRQRGMGPWHIERIEKYQDDGAGELDWQPVFRGTNAECLAELDKRLANEPPRLPLLDRIIRRLTGRPTTKAQRRAERGALTPRLRYQILERDYYRCRKCGAAAEDGAVLHVDHIIPVAMGGRTIPANLETLCDTCNLGKGATMPPAEIR